jgi:cell division protein FtsI (penicillin-binding protein 3)
VNRRKGVAPLRSHAWRGRAVLGAFALAVIAIEIRLGWLQFVDAEFFLEQTEIRQFREVEMPVHRGQILARGGEPLAISTPVDSIFANPSVMHEASADIRRLAAAVGRDGDELIQDIQSRSDKEFRWVERHLSPAAAAKVLALESPGGGVRREYKRVYPAHEVACQLIGFTDIDDVGIQGLEKVYDQRLSGQPGLKTVQRDQRGRVIADVKLEVAPTPGRDVTLSIDNRLQYAAYLELKRVVEETSADWASMVIIDVETGELLAMVNQPYCNPNDSETRDRANFRNFAITDPIEPGSTLKPLVLAAALAVGYTPETLLDVPQKYYVDGRFLTDDPVERGRISVTEVLARSSNVGMAMIGERIGSAELLQTFKGFGLGESTAGAVLGDFASPGRLNEDYERWRPSEKATLSYGYGLSATALQLVRAYATIGSGGFLPEIQLEPVMGIPERRRVLDPEVARDLMLMLEAVVASEPGTGHRASIPHYRVAGKTGTAKISRVGGYAEDRFHAVFAGLAPASRPRFAAVVIVSDPRGTEYGGGDVAAPVFSRVIGRALSLYSVAPDAIEEIPELLSQAEAPR